MTLIALTCLGFVYKIETQTYYKKLFVFILPLRYKWSNTVYTKVNLFTSKPTFVIHRHRLHSARFYAPITIEWVPFVKFGFDSHFIHAVTESVGCCPSTGVHPIARDRDWCQVLRVRPPPTSACCVRWPARSSICEAHRTGCEYVLAECLVSKVYPTV